jgi:hypothetical protein
MRHFDYIDRYPLWPDEYYWIEPEYKYHRAWRITEPWDTKDYHNKHTLRVATRRYLTRFKL